MLARTFRLNFPCGVLREKVIEKSHDEISFQGSSLLKGEIKSRRAHIGVDSIIQ